MTQEKELLFKDLSAKLSYGVKGRVYAECSKGEYDINGYMIFFDSPFDVTLDDINISTEEIHVTAIGNDDTIAFIEDQQTWGSPYTIDEFKPYLRPLSSMTEEEARDIAVLHDNEPVDILSIKVTDEYIDIILDDGHCSTITSTIWFDEIISSVECFDYLNKHMFDYRGLIPKGLAYAVTKENNPYII